MDVKFAAQELFLKFSEAQSYGFFMSFFNIGVDYVRDVLKHDPTKIISSFIYREEDKTRRFLNGNFEGFRYAINQFHQGGH
jgi:hypothetical protein